MKHAQTDSHSTAAAGTSTEGRADEARSLRHPCGAPPGAGEVREVVAGLLWLRMPLPFTLNHINLWAIADADEAGPGWAIVDTGASTADAITAWRTLTAPEGPLMASPQGGRVTRVIVTHMHPDHVGMAGWLTRKFHCRLWMTRLEYMSCRTLVADTGREAPEDAIRFYHQCGWSEAALDLYRARFGRFGKYVHALPDSYRRIVDGETIRIGAHDWQVVGGSGHSPEHACLRCDTLGVLISGDQVLPRISSNVSVFPTEPDADPLGEWMSSLSRLRAMLPDSLLVLPAHGEPFHGLHARLDRLVTGHRKALDRLLQGLDEPKRAIDVFGALFARAIDSMGELFGMATGESLAHLNHLVVQGAVRRFLGDDGVMRYQRS